MSTSVRTPGAVGWGVMAKRAAATLSDGSAVLCVQDGASFYIYHSANRSTWTLKNTITPGSPANLPATAGAQTNKSYSFTAGTDNNLHLAYQANDNTIRYYRLNYAVGPVWTPAVIETAMAATVFGGRVDIDVIDGTNVVVVGLAVFVTNAIRFKSAVRHTGNAWVGQTDRVLAGTNSVSAWYNSVAVAWDRTQFAANEYRFAYMAHNNLPNMQSGVDYLFIKRVNITTGVQTSDATVGSVGFFANQNPLRDFYLFSSGSNEWVALAHIGMDPPTSYGYACRFSSAGVLTPWTRSPATNNDRKSYDQGVGFGYVADVGMLLYRDRTSGVAVSMRVRLDRTKNKFVWTNYWPWDNNNKTPAPWRFVGGNNRNQSMNKIDTFIGSGHPAGTGEIRHQHNLYPITPYAPDGGTFTTDIPTLRGMIQDNYPVPQRGLKLRWQIASDAGFTVNLKTITQDDLLFAGAPFNRPVSRQQILGISDALFQGTWYMRVYQIDEFNSVSVASGTTTFYVDHPPTPLMFSPVANRYVLYVAAGTLFSWDFIDPSPIDVETAAQIVVSRQDDDSIVTDTGKVATTAETMNVVISAAVKDVALQWELTVWDRDDVASEVEGPVPFYVGDPPAITWLIPALDGDAVDRPNPTFDWDVTVGGSRTQLNYRIIVRRGSTMIYDSGRGIAFGSGALQPLTDTTHTVPRAILNNNDTASVELTVTDTAGLVSRSTRTFVVAFTPPATPTFTVDAASYDTLGYVAVSWTNAARDTAFQAWRIYRRKVGTSDWTLVYEESRDLTSYTYADWLVGAGNSWEYVVVQVAIRYGVPIESNRTIATVTTASDSYWLIHPTDKTLNMRLRNVTDDSYNEEYEESELLVVGRGRVIEFGTRFGYVGSLTAQFRDALDGTTGRTMRLQLETLKADLDSMYLRNPFGDVWWVMMSTIDVKRVAGVGSREFVDVTIPYKEVAT